MKVQMIKLENWKIFTDPIEIELTDGLNILYGPNESGKSTIIDSIITTFYNKHTSNSQKIKSLKPWGTQLQPYSSITFQKKGHNYRISKFFNKKKSILEKKEADRWKKIAEEDRADKELIELVGVQLSSQSDSKPKSWGLGQTLWMIQGQPNISDDLNDETLNSLQTMVGATIESDNEKQILSEIRARFLDIFTEKKKSLKRGCSLSKTQEEISQLKDEISKLQEDQKIKDELVHKIEDNLFLLEKNQKSLKSAKKERDQLAQEVEYAKKHQQSREKLENEITGLNKDFKSKNDVIEEIETNLETISKIKLDNEKLQIQIDPLDAEFSKLNKKIESQVQNLDEVNKKLDETIAKKNLAGIAHTTVMDEISLKNLESNFNDINQLYEDLELVQEEYNTIIAPSTSEFRDMKGLHQKIHDSKTRLLAMGLNIKTTAQTQINGEIVLDDKSNTFSLEKNEHISWTANQSLKIKIKDLGEFEVKSGSQDVKDMKKELENMQAEYRDLVAPYGLEKLDDINSLIMKNESKEKEIKRIKTEINKKSDKSKETLQEDIISLKNKIKSNWNQIPDDSKYKNFEDNDKSVLRDKLSNNIVQLQDNINTLTLERNNLNYLIESDRKTAQDLNKKIGESNTEYHGKTQRIQEIEKRQLKLEEDGLSIEERENTLDQLSVELEQKNRALKVYNDEIEEKESKPLGAFVGLNNKVERLEKEVRKQEIDKAGMESKLQIFVNQSTDSNKLEEKLVQLLAKEKELKIEAEALKLLFDLTTFYRENTINEISEPICKRVSENMEKLIGPKYVLNINKQMKPESIHVSGEDAPINLLSCGMQEQIWCLFRLALGNVLSKDEPQLVVLDDPLVNTDPVRMHRALEILEENGKNMQIVVVTCDVDKYNSLVDANFISL